MTVLSVTEVRNALRCPRIFALGRLGNQQASFPVGSSSLGAPFHRLVARFAQTVSTPPAFLAALGADAPQERVAHVLGGWIIGHLITELDRVPAYQTMPAEVDDLAEALRELARYLARRVAGRPPASALREFLQEAEAPIEADLALAKGVSVIVRGQIDAIHASGAETEVVEYKLTEESNEDLDRAQVALYRALLRRAQGIEATAVILRFGPHLRETRIPGVAADVLFQERLLPLLTNLAHWAEAPLDAPRTDRRDLCTGCPMRRNCAATYQDRLEWRDDPPAGGARHSVDPTGNVTAGSAPDPAPSAPLPRDTDGEAEAALLEQRVLKILRDRGVNAQTTGSPCVGPRLVSVDVLARNAVRRLHQCAEDVIHVLKGDHGVDATYEKTAGRRTFSAVRSRPRQVDLRHLLAEKSAWLRERAGRFVVGEGIDGTVEVGDLSSPACCHLLVGGAAGSGKSVFLRALIASMTAFHSPAALQFTLVDPKRVTFGPIVARGLCDYLTGPLCYEVEDALYELSSLIDEMERRYQRMEQASVEDLDSLNQELAPAERLPHHVVVIDEFADLMGVKATREEFVNAVRRLGAKARAAGIHLVLATQRPDATVVPGLIKANLTGRIALRVASAVNSRIIIDQAGAETLLGNGDLLVQAGGGVVRAQAAFVG
jgi:S-DNA-T family DNA segregation ATPase FtsK/SpoIIIE